MFSIDDVYSTTRPRSGKHVQWLIENRVNSAGFCILALTTSYVIHFSWKMSYWGTKGTRETDEYDLCSQFQRMLHCLRKSMILRRLRLRKVITWTTFARAFPQLQRKVQFASTASAHLLVPGWSCSEKCCPSIVRRTFSSRIYCAIIVY